MPPRTYQQAKYWILTIPHHEFLPYLPPQCLYLRGQLELGDSGFLHWQLVTCFQRKVRLTAVRNVFGPFHAEPTKSDAALEYVWKDETAIPDTRFELGALPLSRGRTQDWEAIRNHAKNGELDLIPPDVYVRNYNQLRRIATDHLQPNPIEREVVCYWGRTGSGKSRRAWGEAGMDAYPKDPRTKFWDGYRNHRHVVIDEFRGGIDIAHLLRWFDRYPVVVEVKGSSQVLNATKIWITSNIPPEQWYPDVDAETMAALRRRIAVTHFN